jgi:hypothetical protein
MVRYNNKDHYFNHFFFFWWHSSLNSDLVLTRPTLYHLSQPPTALFCFSHFLDRVSCFFPRAGLRPHSSYLYLPVAGVTDWSLLPGLLVEMAVPLIFLPGLAFKPQSSQSLFLK